MNIQIAIDRVSIQQAIQIIEQVREFADIIEIGTSLIKEYGVASVAQIRKKFPNLTLLADIKTIDQAEYEFRMVFEAGADIATVMGMSATRSIEICQKVSQELNKGYMIDLLEVSEDKLEVLKKFDDAYFGIHLPTDQTEGSIESLVKKLASKLPQGCKIAAAGGIRLDQIPRLAEYGVKVAIVGGAITKASDIKEAAKTFYDEKERLS